MKQQIVIIHSPPTGGVSFESLHSFNVMFLELWEPWLKSHVDMMSSAQDALIDAYMENKSLTSSQL